METFDNQTEKLTPDQVQALAALLTEKDIKAAAAKAGCGETTLHRWLKEDANFKSVLGEQKKALLDSTVRRLASVSVKAVNTLEDIMENKKTPAGIRVRAAAIILDQAVKQSEFHDLEDRLKAIEEAAAHEI